VGVLQLESQEETGHSPSFAILLPADDQERGMDRTPNHFLSLRLNKGWLGRRTEVDTMSQPTLPWAGR
jgi:hypothetical protein